MFRAFSLGCCLSPATEDGSSNPLLCDRRLTGRSLWYGVGKYPPHSRGVRAAVQGGLMTKRRMNRVARPAHRRLLLDSFFGVL